MLKKVFTIESDAHKKDKTEGINQGRTATWILLEVIEIDEII